MENEKKENIEVNSPPAPEKEKQVPAKKLRLKFTLPLLIVGLLILLIGLFIFVLNNSKNPNLAEETSLSPTPEAQTITPTSVPSPTPISNSNMVFPTPAPLKEYVSTEDGIMFSYPENWKLTMTKTHPDIHPNDEYENFILSLKQNNNQSLMLEVNLTFSAWGVGGGCPGFDPKEQNIKTQKINVLGKDLYLVDGSYDGKTIYSEYAIGDPKQCPNVAFTKIDGIPGLFAADIAYFDKQNIRVPQEKNNFINRPEILTAEKIIQSLAFIK